MNKPVTCTAGPAATTGERCGEPAVTVFTGRDGAVYAECEAHAPSAESGTCGGRIYDLRRPAR